MKDDEAPNPMPDNTDLKQALLKGAFSKDRYRKRKCLSIPSERTVRIAETADPTKAEDSS